MKRGITLFIVLVVLIMSTFCGCEDRLGKDGGGGLESSGGGISSINYHTVKFQTNGGTSVSSKKVRKLESAPETTRKGYIFDGWFRDVNLTQAAVYPLEINDDIILYAKWIKKSDTSSCRDCKIKFMDDVYNSSCSYNVSPTGFDYDRLSELGYNGIKITVEYSVYYCKDYDVWFDVGYAGSPKYEVKITNGSNYGQFDYDMPTSTSSKTRTIELCTTFDYYRNSSVMLKFSTNNIQNIIYFKDIKVTYLACRVSD